MNIEQKLKDKFTKINKAFFEKESGNDFLRVEVEPKTLDEVTKLSREISDYLDEIDTNDNEYILDVYSSGTDKVIAIDELANFTEEHIQITLNEAVKDKETYEGKIVEINESNVIIRWNAKGQFRKQEIEKDNIKQINLFAIAK